MKKIVLVDLYDVNHKLLKVNIPLENLSKEFDSFKKKRYYVMQKLKDNSIIECYYVKKGSKFEKSLERSLNG